MNYSNSYYVSNNYQPKAYFIHINRIGTNNLGYMWFIMRYSVQYLTCSSRGAEEAATG